MYYVHTFVRERNVLYYTHTHTHTHTHIHTHTHSLSHSPANTSNDLAIAQQIHQDLNQLKEEGTGATVVPLKPRGSTRVVTLRSTGAAGRGPPGDNMTYKTNFESMRFVSDDPNYYSYGYELGKGMCGRYRTWCVVNVNYMANVCTCILHREYTYKCIPI